MKERNKTPKGQIHKTCGSAIAMETALIFNLNKNKIIIIVI